MADGGLSALPSNIEAEQALLGVLLYEPDVFPDLGNLTATDFYEPFHGRLFESISRRIASGQLADPVTVLPDFETDVAFEELGSIRYLADLVDRAPTSAAAVAYAQTIRDYARRRRLLQIGDHLAASAAAGDHLGIQDAEQALAELRRSTSPFRIKPASLVDPTTIPTRQWLYGHHLIRKYVSTTISPGGLGKSSLVLAEAVAMASGRRLLGDRPDGTLRVFYWNGEDPQDEIDRRLAAVCLEHKVSNQDLGDRLFTASGRDMSIQIASMGPHGVILNETLIAQLIQQLKHHRIDVLSVDPFVSLHSVPENDNGAIDAVIKRGFARIANEVDCAIEIVHHTRKPGGGASKQETSVDDARGASALLGAVRSARVLNEMTEQEAVDTGVENRHDYFRVDNGKANMSRRTSGGKWFEKVSVDLRNGAASDLVPAVRSWELPGLFADVSPDKVVEMQRLVGIGEHRLDAQAKLWVGYAVGMALHLDAHDQDVKKRIKRMIDTWVKTGFLVVEERQDEKRDLRKFVVPGTPSDGCRTS